MMLIVTSLITVAYIIVMCSRKQLKHIKTCQAFVIILRYRVNPRIKINLRWCIQCFKLRRYLNEN